MAVTEEQALATIKTVFPNAKIIARDGSEREISLSNTTESPLSITFKSPRGSLITARGDDGAALAVNLQQLSEQQDTAEGPMSVIEILTGIEAAMGGSSAPAAASSGQQAPQQEQGNLNPPCPTCGGATQEKSGTGAKGPWKGYFCATGDKSHKVKWG